MRNCCSASVARENIDCRQLQIARRWEPLPLVPVMDSEECGPLPGFRASGLRRANAGVAQGGVADADASLAGLAGEKQDDDLDLLAGLSWRMRRGEKVDFLQSLGGIGDPA